MQRFYAFSNFILQRNCYNIIINHLNIFRINPESLGLRVIDKQEKTIPNPLFFKNSAPKNGIKGKTQDVR